ncbi:MAG: Fic family protein, partial [Proteobacteria bacterium]|nr:Fic family protein [Pseudomonadota bacterium]
HNSPLLLLLSLVWAFPSAAAFNCKEPFLKLHNPENHAFKPAPPRRDPSRTEPPFRGSQEEAKKVADFLLSRLPGAPSAKALLKLSSGHLSSERAKAFSDWLLGQFSEDAIVTFEDNYLGRQQSEYPEGPKRYNKNGERPFDGYLAARDFLETLPLESIDLNGIKTLHKKLMSRESIRGDKGKVFQSDGRPARNSQGLKDSELGVIRDENVGFEIDGKHLPQGVAAVGKTLAHLLPFNPYLEKTRDGFVSYAPLSHWYHIDSRKQLSPDLVKKIQLLERKYGEEGLAQRDLPEIKAVQRELLEELTAKTWEEAKKDVKNAQTRKEVIAAIARFQRELASIHPFVDGNGRIVRLLTEKLLESRELPAPLYLHWGEDISLNPRESENHLAHSLQLSGEFHSALQEALSTDKGFESVLNPVLAIRAKELLGDPTGTFDSKAFLKWCQENRHHLTSFKEAVVEFSKTQPQTQALKEEFNPEVMERAKKVMASKAPHFNAEEFDLWRREHSQPGRRLEEEIRDYANWVHDLVYEDKSGAIRLASPTFQRTFGKLSTTQEEYDEKIYSFYSNDKIYRGVPSDKYVSDRELAQLFVRQTGLTIGNGVSSREAPESALPAFQQFNAGLLREEGHLRKQIIDHKNGLTEDYHMSGMVSFSEKRHVADHWSWDPAQPFGFVFTARKRQVGVVNTAKHTPRLDQLGMHNEFEEAMVGGIDPESIMTAELLQHNSDMTNGTPRRMKRATRISFDKIQIAETTFDEMDRPRLGNRTTWQIFPDGSVKQITEESGSH